jgi:hypothetical protein
MACVSPVRLRLGDFDESREGAWRFLLGAVTLLQTSAAITGHQLTRYPVNRLTSSSAML